ncbi:hypothetical protein JXB12_03125 [candidate division KSB1 bacterium]|nr:hypothetical protein [candidate division KSB1 bacterium]
MSKITKVFIGFAAIVLILALIANTPIDAKSKYKTNATGLAKPAELSAEQFDGNTIACWMENTGLIVSQNVTGSSGMEWPKGSNKTIDYASGLWLFGKTPSGEIRSASSEYATEFQPGQILASGALSNPDDPKYRIYKINSDGTGDWDVWPFDQGAPSVKDKTGKDSLDTEGKKIPQLIGDQTLFWVMNDGNLANHGNFMQTNVMNLEQQVLIFGYNTANPLGNIMFIKWNVVNKSSIDYDSVYVAVWDDPDLGDASDDLVGCDIELGMGFCYNGGPVDATYGTTPPALGFDFFQGPEVDGEYLPMTSFIYYWNGAPDPFGDPEDAQQGYNFMKGLRSDGTPYTDPDGNNSRFVFNGDPVTQSGWLDSKPDDRRFLMSSGPFQLKAGDTQEIVGAKIIAPGTDNLAAVNALRFFDSFAQTAFDNNFDLPVPPAPVLEGVGLDGEVVLKWQDAGKRYQTIEGYDFKGYKFEGYNVYQGESVTGPWKLIKTIDLVNEFGIVFDNTYDAGTGMVLEKPVTFGSNTGMSREYRVSSDAIAGLPFYNYKTYYFAVTSYAINPDISPKVVESGQIALAVNPSAPALGQELHYEYAELVEVNHVSGSSDAKVVPVVVDPTRTIDAIYEVVFGRQESASKVDEYWHLLRNGNRAISFNRNFSGDEDYPIVDGIKWRVSGSFAEPLDFSKFIVTPEGNADNYDIDSYFVNHWSEFSAAAWDVYGLGHTDVETLQRDFEFRFTGVMSDDGLSVVSGGQLATFEGARQYDIATHPLNPNPGVAEPFLVRIPFEVWDVEDPDNPRQVNYSIYDRGQADPTAADFTVFDLDGRMYTCTFSSDYDEQIHMPGEDPTATWNLVTWEVSWSPGDVVKFVYDNPIVAGTDVFKVTPIGFTKNSKAVARGNIDKINAVPNPYFSWNPAERTPTTRIMRITNLPPSGATIRIFDLAGNLVTVIDDAVRSNQGTLNSSFAEWNLRNSSDVPVASGMYIAHIEVPGVGEKTLKLAVINRDERLLYF